MSILFAELHRIALDAIAAAAGEDVEQLTPSVNILDLGLDSLDFWQILMEIEDGVGMDVPAHVLDRLVQAQDELTVEELLSALNSWQAGNDSYDASIGDVVVISEL